MSANPDFTKNPRESHPVTTFSILNDEDPKAESYCFRHGVYMDSGPVVIKKNGGMYSLSADHELYYCKHCHGEIMHSEDVPDDLSQPEFTNEILKKAIKNHFEIWDDGGFDTDMYQYISEGEMSDLDEGTLITFGPHEENFKNVDNNNVERSLSEPSPDTKQMRVLNELKDIETPITANELSAQSTIGQCSSQLSTLWVNKMVERSNVGNNGLEYAYWLSDYAKILLNE